MQTLSLVKRFDCVADALRYFKINNCGLSRIEGRKIGNLFMSNLKFEYKFELYNYIMRLSKYSSNNLDPSLKYLISENINTGVITYYTTTNQCAKHVGISRSMIFKHKNATKDHPYIPVKNPFFKIYFSPEFIPYVKSTVLDGEPPILLSGKIEERPEMDNIEITSWMTKG